MPEREPSAQATRLRMRGVHKRFGATVALDGVDLDVEAGSVHALVGENGAGKSTLMKVLAGAHRPDAGRLWLDGAPYRPRSPVDGRHAGVAMIYQELSLAPHLSVMDNILLGVEPHRGPLLRRRAIRVRAAEALARVDRADLPLDAPVSRLPIADRQLVEIARSVAVGARVLVLDEPTSSLSQPDVDRLFTLVRSLRDAGVAVVYISHVLEEVRAIADRFTVLRDGRSVGGGAAGAAALHDIVAMMVGRAVTELYPRSSRTPGETLLELHDLVGVRRPRSASLVVRRGEIVGLAGLVGAGRTELLRVIFGLDPVVRGSVRVGGNVRPARPPRRWRQGVGFVSEDRQREGLATRLGVADNLTMASLAGRGRLGVITPRACDRMAAPWIGRLPIRCASTRQRVDELSGGNQQKVAIARLLAADVDVLLLDEPTRGIDVGAKAQIYALIDRLAVGDPARGRAPKAVLMASSSLPELLGTCDRIAVMRAGRLGPARPVAALDEHGLMAEAVGAGETGEPGGGPGAPGGEERP